MKRILPIYFFGLIVCSQQPFAKSASDAPLTGEQIMTEFSGKIISDGHHWSILLNPDYSAKAFMMGKARQGLWKVKNDQFCMAVPSKAGFDCWLVISRNKKFIFMASGKEQFEITAEVPSAKFQLD